MLRSRCSRTARRHDEQEIAHVWLLLIELLLRWLLAIRDAIGAAVWKLAVDVGGAVGEALVAALLHIAGIAALVLCSAILLGLLVWHERRTVG
jgi:hypothetical protein